MKKNKLPKCPRCGKILDCYFDPESPDDPHTPKPDDNVICIGCGSHLRFDINMKLVLPPSERN